MLKINMNKYVYIKPKPRDLEAMKAHDDEVFAYNKEWKNPIEYYQKKVAPDGMMKLQIHDFMNYFGTQHYVGGWLPGDGNFYFMEQDLKQTEQ